jgi:hypothetical protein
MDELLAYVAERVAPYKKLREIERVDEIPKSASGKILPPPSRGARRREGDRLVRRGGRRAALQKRRQVDHDFGGALVCGPVDGRGLLDDPLTEVIVPFCPDLIRRTSVAMSAGPSITVTEPDLTV